MDSDQMSSVGWTLEDVNDHLNFKYEGPPRNGNCVYCRKDCIVFENTYFPGQESYKCIECLSMTALCLLLQRKKVESRQCGCRPPWDVQNFPATCSECQRRVRHSNVYKCCDPQLHSKILCCGCAYEFVFQDNGTTKSAKKH